MKGLTIGKIARLAGVGVETLRYYEREGLIPEPPRKRSGYRQYPESTVSTLHFIQKAKELGFSLREIKELLSLHCDPNATKADVKKKALVKIAEIDNKIHTLQRMRNALAGLTEQCDGEGPVSECPIIHAMEDDHEKAAEAAHHHCHPMG